MSNNSIDNMYFFTKVYIINWPLALADSQTNPNFKSYIQIDKIKTYSTLEKTFQIRLLPTNYLHLSLSPVGILARDD